MKTRYIRLLSYSNAMKFIHFVCNDLTGEANIVTSGVRFETDSFTMGHVINFLEELNVPYEVSNEQPHKTVERIKDGLRYS